MQCLDTKLILRRYTGLASPKKSSKSGALNLPSNKTFTESDALEDISKLSLSFVQKICEIHKHCTKASTFAMREFRGKGLCNMPHFATNIPKVHSILMCN